MFSTRLATTTRQNTHILRKICKIVAVLLVIVMVILSFLNYMPHYTNKDYVFPDKHPPLKKSKVKATADPCASKKSCPEDHFSFLMLTGAANAILPKICVQGKLVLGAVLNNGGLGINIVILNGKTAEVIKTGHFNMYDGETGPLIKFLQDLEEGSLALMASFDEPSTKLTAEARQLISDLGSSNAQSIGYRDSWAFVGAKGTRFKSPFEKLLKNDAANNKYEGWPEMLELEGCIPPYMPSASS